MSIKFWVKPFLCLALLNLFCLLSAAQQTPPDPATQAPKTDEKKDSTQSPAPGQAKPGEVSSGTSTQGKVAGTSNDRLFYALPNFLTMEHAGQLPPLTRGAKFKVVFLGSFDYIQIPWYGFLSGISQAENSEPGYGQGAEGYGKRFASAFADGTIENFMVGAVFPSLLHQDPRYYQLGKGSFLHRTEYAISRSFVTRSDSGHGQFNYSEILGGMVSAAFSTNTYHPKSFTTVHYSTTGMPTYVFTPSDRTLGNTSKVWSTQLGYDTLTLVVKEFWPDVHRRISRKQRSEGALSPAPNPTSDLRPPTSDPGLQALGR